MANPRMIGGRDFLLRVVTQLDRPLHVGLARAEPDFAHQYVVPTNGRRPGDGHRQWTASWLRRKLDLPLAGGVRLAAGARFTQLDGDLCAWLIPTPHGNLPITLEHHVLAEYGRQTHFGDGQSRQNGNESEQQGEASFGFHRFATWWGLTHRGTAMRQSSSSARSQGRSVGS